MQPKVSVIIPVYNSEKYLRDCLDSALGQTLENIEIICVNDGSTDGSLNILREYAERDSRVQVIDKPNAGYGHTMNVGLDRAQGEYVAFLESDDMIREDAYERLSRQADEQSLDIIKADYYELRGEGKEALKVRVRLSKDEDQYNAVVKPVDTPWTFYMPMMNAIGLLRRDMIECYHIRHNETPGAAHQDMGFWFQTFCCAESLLYVDEPFYIYRQDNPSSSMNSDKTTFCTLDEYTYIEQFLLNNPSLKQKILPVFYHRKFQSAMFSYKRAELSLRLPFLRKLAEEYRRDQETGNLDTSRFKKTDQEKLQQLLDNPDAYYLRTLSTAYDNETKALKSEIARLRTELQNERVRDRKTLADGGSYPRDQVENNCLISFVIPVFNAERYLPACLDSIFSQPFDDFEVVCVNDGSTDNSLAILENYAAEHPSMRVISQSNEGQGAARNTGMAVADGEYIQFVDSDDCIATNYYDILEPFFDRKICFDALYFDGLTLYESEELKQQFKSFQTTYLRDNDHTEEMTGKELFNRLKAEKAYRVSPCMALYRRSFLINRRILFPEGVIYEDNAFTLKAICLAARVLHLNEPLYCRRIRTGSTMTKPKTAYNCQSYLTVYLEMLEFALGRSWDYETSKNIASELSSTFRHVRKQYEALGSDEKALLACLAPIQQSVMNIVIAQSDQKTELSKIKKELKKAQVHLTKLKNSNSWRIGRLVTKPMRFFKRAKKS